MKTIESNNSKLICVKNKTTRECSRIQLSELNDNLVTISKSAYIHYLNETRTRLHSIMPGSTFSKTRKFARIVYNSLGIAIPIGKKPRKGNNRKWNKRTHMKRQG